MFRINYKIDKPACCQIVDNFKQLISTGILTTGVVVPPVFEMTNVLTVNPSIVQQAYLHLESIGVFETTNGGEWYVCALAKTALMQSKPSPSCYCEHSQATDNQANPGNDKRIPPKTKELLDATYIETRALVKKFNGKFALNQLTLKVAKGSIYGLVGTNGAGKTTALKHLAGVLQQDRGKILINNETLFGGEHTEVVAYITDDIDLFPHYTIKMVASFFKMKYKNWNNARYEELIALFNLDIEQRISTLSKGLQKQAGFALSISTMPNILLLDETLDGVNPAARTHILRHIVNDVAIRRMTVIVTSHNTKGLDTLCDVVGIMKSGRIVLERNLNDLRTNVHKIHVMFSPSFLEEDAPFMGLNVLHKDEYGNYYILIVRGRAGEIFEHINKFNPVLLEFLPISIEEIFDYEAEVEGNGA